jgi:hypothetical protein
MMKATFSDSSSVLHIEPSLAMFARLDIFLIRRCFALQDAGFTLFSLLS